MPVIVTFPTFCIFAKFLQLAPLSSLSIISRFVSIISYLYQILIVRLCWRRGASTSCKFSSRLISPPRIGRFSASITMIEIVMIRNEFVMKPSICNESDTVFRDLGVSAIYFEEFSVKKWGQLTRRKSENWPFANWRPPAGTERTFQGRTRKSACPNV